MESPMYQSTIPVKYFSIYHELVAKGEFTEEEIGGICDDIYRQELMTAMDLLSTNSCAEGAWGARLKELRDQLVEYPPFAEWLARREFTYLFSWELFHLFHPLIAEWDGTRSMSTEKLTEIGAKYDSLFPHLQSG